MRQRRAFVDLAAPLAAALAVALILAVGASAHVSLVPKRTEASTAVTLTFVAPGEHERAMVAFRVRLPRGLTVLEGGQPGWRFAVANGAAIWAGGRVTPYGTAFFRLRVRSPAEGGVHQFVAVQRYADGHADRWTVPLTVAEASPGQNFLAGGDRRRGRPHPGPRAGPPARPPAAPSERPLVRGTRTRPQAATWGLSPSTSTLRKVR